VAIDLSRVALALAVRNARRHGVESRVSFLQADLLAPLAQPADIIVANLPYVCTADWEALPPEIREHEPRCALDGGPDGLSEIERLLEQAPACLRPGGSLLVELGPPQAAPSLALARRCFPGAAVRVLPDAAGLERMLAIDAPSA
jgi:release factor glutamine methyltransferase